MKDRFRWASGKSGRIASARSYQVIASSHRPCRASVIPTLSRASGESGRSRKDDSSHVDRLVELSEVGERDP